MVISRRMAFALMILVLLLWSVPQEGATARSFWIESAEIHARLDEQGNMEVSERDIYRFDGSFNGILVVLDQAVSGGIEAFQAFEVTDGEERPLMAERSVDKTQVTYRVFAPASDERKEFRLSYRVLNVVQVHADTAELYWKFFDQSNESRIGTLDLYIHLPAPVDGKDLLAFGHGPLSGEVVIQDGGVVRYSISPLEAREMLEARLLFPPHLVPGSSRVNQQPALERIKAEELRWADQADRRRRADELARHWVRYAGVALALANLTLAAVLYLRYGRQPRPDWQGAYYRELPADITPAVMSHLLSNRVQPRDLMATLVDLVRKGYLEMRMVELPGGLFKRQRVDYRFRRINVAPQNLKAHEGRLIDWFFGEVVPAQAGTGSGDPQQDELSLVALQGLAETRRTADGFVERFDQWGELVVTEANSHGWSEQNPGRRSALLLGLVQAIPILFLGEGEIPNLFFSTLPTFAVIPLLRRRTKKGATEYAKWQAFKRFLSAYSQLSQRELPAVHLWEHYLVYAMALGVAERLIGVLHLDMPRTEDRPSHLYAAVADHRFHREFGRLSTAMDRTVSVARSRSGANSSRGSGGGFSSGGGGGGGGGGRGAF